MYRKGIYIIFIYIECNWWKIQNKNFFLNVYTYIFLSSPGVATIIDSRFTVYNDIASYTVSLGCDTILQILENSLYTGLCKGSSQYFQGSIISIILREESSLIVNSKIYSYLNDRKFLETI